MNLYNTIIGSSLSDGLNLTIRGKLMRNESHADDRQLWTLDTNGDITSATRPELGLSLTKNASGSWKILVSTVTKRVSHYSWSLMYGTYERRYNEIHKREILVIITFIRIILMTRSAKGKCVERERDMES